MSAKALDPVTASQAATATLTGNLEAIRIEILHAKDDRATVERLAVTREEAARRLESWIDRMEGDALARLDLSRFTAPTYREPSGPDVPALVLAFLSEAMRKDVRQRLATIYDGSAGVSAEDRTRLLSELDEKLLRLERQEERIIRNAERDGFDILRRSNADPRAVLAFDEDLT